MNVEKKFLQAINDFNLISENEKILIAYSTGVDSSVLTYLLLKFKNYLKIKEIALAYLNHKLRKEAEEEEIFTKEVAEKFGIKAFTKQVNIKEIAKKEKKSVEQVGREERYKFFNGILKKEDFDKIATGHHLSDLAETMTLWFIQGNKKGIKGFKPKEKNIIRPLYYLTKEEIYNYAKEKQIEYKEDITNYSVDFKRNKVRHEIIPKLKEINPSFENSALIMSYFFNLDEDYFNKKIENFDLLVDFIELNQIKEKAILYRLIDKWIYEKIGCKLSYKTLKSIIDLVETGGTKKVKICNNYYLIKEYDRLYLNLEKKEKTTYFEYTVKPDEKIYLKEMDRTLEIFKLSNPNLEDLKNEKEMVCFDIDSKDIEFKIRQRKKGDRFKPFGSSWKKLKDVMIDLKIPADMRDNIPLLTFKDKILWIIGYKRSDLYPINENSKNVICFKLKEV